MRVPHSRDRDDLSSDAHDLLADADVQVHRGSDGVLVRADLRPRPGMPDGAGAGIVDAVVALPGIAEGGGHVHAAIDVGDARTLARVHEHTERVHTHLAGSTCIIDAELLPAHERATHP